MTLGEISQRVRKKRSKTGCLTCRQRKVRCDEGHPTCNACLRLALPCKFPASLIGESAATTIPAQVPSADDTSFSYTARRRGHRRIAERQQLQSLLLSPNVFPDDATTSEFHSTNAAAIQAPVATVGNQATADLNGSAIQDVQGTNDTYGPNHGHATGAALVACQDDAGVLASTSRENAQVPDYQQLSTSWWSSLGEGLLDVNWLECWTPELNNEFYNDREYGIGLRPPETHIFGHPHRPSHQVQPPPNFRRRPHNTYYQKNSTGNDFQGQASTSGQKEDHCKQKITPDIATVSSVAVVPGLDTHTGSLAPPGHHMGTYRSKAGIETDAGMAGANNNLSPESPSEQSTSPTTVVNKTPYQRDVILRPEDRPLLQHFTTTMVRFCILRNCVHDNLYNYILLNMGLFYSSLFDAMMAYAALHLAQIEKKGMHIARERYERAYTALIEDLGHNTSPSLLLAIIWFLMQYQLILAEGVEGFCELINMAAEVARTELQCGDADAAMKRIGPVGALILVWMSARDSQVAYLGLGGRLLGCLKTFPYIYELVDTSSVSNEDDTFPPLENGNIVFMEREQISERSKPSEMQRCMKLSFQNVTVAGQVRFIGRNMEKRANISGHYNRKRHPSQSYILIEEPADEWRFDDASAIKAAWETIRMNLGLLQRDIELDDTPAAKSALGVAMGDLTAMPIVEPIHYNRMLLLATYYTTVIQYHTFCSDSSRDPELLSQDECASRMIRLCQRGQEARPNSPQGIWPTQVLIAGITTRDPIYQAWAIRTFEMAERWGAHIGKAKTLLREVIRRQNSTGLTVNLLEVMADTTGYFIF